MKRATLALLAVALFATAAAVGLHDVCWTGDGYGSCRTPATGTASPGVTPTGSASLGQVVDDAATPDPSPSASERPPSPTRSVRTSTDGLTAKQRRATPFEVWLASPTSRKVQWRESNNRCDITNPSGKYQGKWQMDDNFWAAYGGRRYAPNPHQATCHEQDLVAYRGWLARGWNPWTTA